MVREKGEIACYMQFLLFPHCFKKTGTADTRKQGLVEEMLKTTIDYHGSKSRGLL